jgi:hypothetical protein
LIDIGLDMGVNKKKETKNPFLNTVVNFFYLLFFDDNHSTWLKLPEKDDF